MATNSSSKSEGRTLGFVILSSLFHTALAVAVFTLSFEGRKMVEVTEVEFVDSKPDLAPVVSAPEVNQASQKIEETAPVQAPAVVKAQQLPTKTAEVKKAASTPKAQPAPVAVAAAEKPVMAEESPVTVPVLETAELSEEVPAHQEQAAELKDEDIANDLDKVDQEQAEKTAAVQEQLNKDTEKEIQEQNEKVAALQKETQEESDKLAAENAQKRAEERAALQAAEAQAAQLASPAGEAGGTGSAQGEIRALEDLKQISGNKKPMYDAEDRLQGRQGEVAFLAYVSKQGGITEFKMIKSSGHRQLDSKTLKAIRNWKFYPGQEGWVEIPFKWDLKGGPQEMPATLRRAKVSSSSNL